MYVCREGVVLGVVDVLVRRGKYERKGECEERLHDRQGKRSTLRRTRVMDSDNTDGTTCAFCAHLAELLAIHKTLANCTIARNTKEHSLYHKKGGISSDRQSDRQTERDQQKQTQFWLIAKGKEKEDNDGRESKCTSRVVRKIREGSCPRQRQDAKIDTHAKAEYLESDGGGTKNT